MLEPIRKDEPEAMHGAVDGLLARVARWWRRPDEFGALPQGEMQRMAGELGLSSQDLAALAARGPHAADLLYQRMAVLGIARADVDRVAFGLVRDLEKSCACCGDKDRCIKDLESRPHDRVWADYCSNAVTLDAVTRTKGRFPA
jgi:hypothetical protein